jgi:hypothetical protein
VTVLNGDEDTEKSKTERGGREGRRRRKGRDDKGEVKDGDRNRIKT